jgi:fructokinase
MARVFCLGEALVDRLLPWGNDPGGDCLGGAPTNVACALARLGTQVGFIGRLGSDAIGADFDRLFEQRGVERQGLQWDQQRPSRIVLVQRDASGDRCFGGFSGYRGQGFADQALEASSLPAELERGVEWLAIGSIPLASPASAAALERAVQWQLVSGGRLAMDVNWRPTFWGLAANADPPAPIREQLLAFLARAQLLKLAAEEAQALFNSRDPQAVANALPQRPAVVITDGGAGVSWCLGAARGSLPAFPVPVQDTTGAGDAFFAGLLHQLVASPELLSGADPEALRKVFGFASACGAVVCMAKGAIDPQPDAAAVESFLHAQLQF